MLMLIQEKRRKSGREWKDDVVTRRLPVGMRAGSSEEKNNGQGQEHTSKTGTLGVREGAPPKKLFHVLCFICLTCLSIL